MWDEDDYEREKRERVKEKNRAEYALIQERARKEALLKKINDEWNPFDDQAYLNGV
jgi:hypothetical protein